MENTINSQSMARSPKIVIIKYNAGNVYSVSSALKRIGHEAIITSDLEEIKSAEKD